ncbi:MAG: DMT family transporter [Clostridia bacterium]|nr:DMT family transporter [Clostridia bacterium]
MDKTKKLGLTGRIMLIVATAFWGTSFVVVGQVVNSIAPSYLIAIRFTFAFIVLSIIFYKKLKLINKSYIVCGSILGVVLFVAFLLQTSGLLSISAGKNAFLTSTYVVFTPFVMWIFSKKCPALMQFVAVALCLTGVGLVSLSNGMTIEIGDIVTLSSGVFYALQIVLTALFVRNRDPIALSIVQFTFVSVIAWLYSVCFHEFPSDMSFDVLWRIGYLAIVCTAVGFTFQNVGQKWVSATSAGIIYSFEAVVAVALDSLINNQPLTAKMIIGFVLIFVSLFVTEIRLPNKKMNE